LEANIATNDVELSSLQRDRAKSKAFWVDWDSRLTSQERERDVLEQALEKQRRRQAMLAAEEGRARAALAEEEDRLVELLAEEADVQSDVTRKEVKLANELAKARLQAKQRHVQNQQAAVRVQEQRRAEESARAQITSSTHMSLEDKLGSVLNADIVGIDAALADSTFEVSMDMRIAAAEAHVNVLDAAHQLARQQLELADSTADLINTYPDAMADLVAERVEAERFLREALDQYQAQANLEALQSSAGAAPYANTEEGVVSCSRWLPAGRAYFD